MVAYSFQKRFAEAIVDGRKRQTIRFDRRRGHVRPGQRMQLYTGMRTRSCRKLLDVTCETVERIRLNMTDGRLASVVVGGRIIAHGDLLEKFARADGFASADDMSSFWTDDLKPDQRVGDWYWEGWLIRWSEALDSASGEERA